MADLEIANSYLWYCRVIIFYFLAGKLEGLSYIKRGQDVEGLIRENELLRASNRMLRKAAQELIQQCSATFSSICPQFNLPLLNQQDVQLAMVSFTDELARIAKEYEIEMQNEELLKKSKEKNIYLSLEERIQQNQSTINELSLIIQKLELELSEKQTEKEQLSIDLSKERLRIDELEKS
jgi:hypothetical protein